MGIMLNINYTSALRLLVLRELRTPPVTKRIQVYSVAGGVQVYSVTNYSTCCFLLHLQLSKNYLKELSWTQHSNTYHDKQTNRQTTIVI